LGKYFFVRYLNPSKFSPRKEGQWAYLIQRKNRPFRSPPQTPTFIDGEIRMATSTAKRKSTHSTDDNKESSITIIKKATCKSLNGTATLDYHIGRDDKSNLHWKIHSNSGNGMFSQEWLAFVDIQKALEAWEKDHPIVSMALYSVYKGKSVNTPSFLLASLVNEGILQQVPDKKRHFQLGDTKAFLASLDKVKVSHTTSAKGKPNAKSKAGTSMKQPRKKPATGKQSSNDK
jgi:hypothetical protein